jgi:hypothetical protein
MPRPKSIEAIKKLCYGCHSDRYNHKGLCERPGIDAPVTCKQCWSLSPDKVLYCRGAKKYVMSCNSDRCQQWLAEWANTGRKPTWRYW